MRSRTVREGSVGLLILLGLALFGGLVLWLRGLSPGNRSFTMLVDFSNVSGMQTGATVRYRGVNVGKITEINPGANGVVVTVEITPADLLISRNAVVEANQSGLIGETYIEITPLSPLPAGIKIAAPLDPKCNPSLIVCNKGRLPGQIGASSDELIRNSIRFTKIYSEPEFVANLNAATKNTAIAAAEVARLSREFTSLSGSIKQQLGTFSTATNSVTSSATQSANQVGLAANQIARTANQFGGVANRFGNTADQLSSTASQYSQTAVKFNQLATNVNGLVVENRATLVSTLNNLSQSSTQLRTTVGSLTPAIKRVNSTFNSINSEQLARNLETLSTNAAQASTNALQASANLRDISASLNDPKNLVILQQTLDSARATFENTQKLTSDLDELTGDPAFRSNLRNLVNGLGKLVSSTQQLQQQVEMAQVLEPASININNAAVNTPPTNTQLQEPVQSPQPQVLPTNPAATLTNEKVAHPQEVRPQTLRMPQAKASPQPSFQPVAEK